APTATITANPTNPSNSTAATFAFGSTETGSSFQCALDGAAFTGCATAVSYTGLAAGSHTFQVKATDLAGNTGAAVSASWTVDTTAPTASITSSPANPTSATSASFVFSASETGSTFQCALDGGAFAGCTSPATYS